MNPPPGLIVQRAVRMFHHVSRTRVVVVALVAGLAGLALPALAQDDGEGDQGGGTPACIDYEGYARYRGYGYYHYVRVTNGCEKRAECDVWTSVTPERHHVSLDPEETETVITHTGSPAREFTPHVSCQLAD